LGTAIRISPKAKLTVTWRARPCGRVEFTAVVSNAKVNPASAGRSTSTDDDRVEDG
jgi:hypothetical protein